MAEGMTSPVDHSEWIDRYLRGELRGEELEVFERRLKQDPQFALEYDSQKLLADGIRLARKEELKRFIAERTRQRVITLPRNRSFLIGLAASIAIFAAGWLGWKSVLPNVQQQELAASKGQNSGDATGNTKSPQAPQQEKEQQDHTLAYQKQEMETLVPVPAPIEEEDVSNERMDAPASEGIEPPDAPDSSPELVASVRVALAEWEAEVPQADVKLKETVTVTKAVPRKSASKALESEERAATTVPSIARSGNSSQVQYDLVFLNNNQPGSAYEMIGTQQIQLFNLTYLNPLLIRYQGRHFLRSGDIWYELSIPSTGRLPLIPLKEKALLKEFGSE